MFECKECGKIYNSIQKMSSHFTRKHWSTKVVTWVNDRKLLTLAQYDNRISKIKKCETCMSEFISEKSSKFCSILCAHKKINHSHEKTDAQKQKISKSIKARNELNLIYKNCYQCGEEFVSSTTNAFCCSPKCSIKYSKSKKPKIKKPLGGYRERSGRGAMGYFENIFCNSTYEAAFIHHCKKNNLKIERNVIGFPYPDENGENRNYFPDFIVENEYVEVKGYMSKRDELKISNFPHKIKVIGKTDVLPMIKELKNDYNVKDIRDLLEKTRIVTKNCEFCEKEFSRYIKKQRFCSSRCSALNRHKK